MITKYKKHHRIIATIFLLIFFPTLVPNNLFASNNGPVAPEATSFEPVDATDMVNLYSGDMSYVLPLLNVPSPEGGYPLALSYHAGIAMDEEASWVGLGWSLNPGAINRSVKGIPDDWDKTRVSELLYDRGQNLDYYDFSIGGTLPNGITIGMSAAWGAHKAWGGVVGYGGIGVGGGSENIDVSAYGASVGYNLDSKKFSGSYTLSAGPFADLSINTSGKVSMSALGISYDTSTDKVSSKFLNTVDRNQSSASTSDYYMNNSSKGFNMNAAGFYWISYQQTHIEYSLFKLIPNYISGTLNLFDSKKESGYVQDSKNYMDVRSHFIMDKNIGVNTQVTLPNYDNYSVSAQGISGGFSPRNFDEVLLYDKGSEPITSSLTSTEMSYLTNPSDFSDAYYKLNNRLFFYFDNVNSSFLRTQTGDFKSLDGTIDINNIDNITGSNREERIVKNIVTDTDNTYSSLYNKDGQLTKVGNRKRDGNFIEAFTNKQIVEGDTNGQFFEVPEYDRQFYKSIAENGIGAYRVTALDGKVYHFSLPVYNFEEVYKNYSNAADENDRFLETIKTKPYATHWLLTAITGPDFVDVNNNNIADEGDYGYWVKFEYGRWSNGYGWRSPKVGAKVYNNRNFYFWGRKEIYYLEKIKTRTHTALFIKDLRYDDKSTPIQYRNGQYQSGPMPRDITENFQDRLDRPIEQGNYYSEYPTNTYQPVNMNFDYDYKHRTYKYVDLPENSSLALVEIILLKNEDALNVRKDIFATGNRTKGHVYFDYGFFGAYSPIRKNPYDVKLVDINCHQNVLTTADLIPVYYQSPPYFDIKSKAVKLIDFGYGSLGNNLPNCTFSSQGRLALTSIRFIGKNNTRVLPPYRFKYLKSDIPYNFNNSDNWGYVKDNPDAWSLNEIITPIGTKIKVEYEPDSFSREAALHTDQMTYSYDHFYRVSSPVDHLPVNYSLQNNTIIVNFKSSYQFANLNDIFNFNQEVNLSFKFKMPGTFGFKEFLNNYTIIGIDNVNKKITLKANDKTDLALQNRFFEGPYATMTYRGGQFDSNRYSYSVNNATEYAYSFQLVANYNRLIAQFGRNGKNGGGLRVSKITTCDFSDSNNMITEYNYFNPYTNNISGVTSFEPSDNPQVAANIQSVEEIPSPNVNYEYVTSTIKNNSGIFSSTVYNFKVMDDIILGDLNDGEYEYKFGDQFKVKFFGGSRRDPYSKNVTRKIILYDYFSNLGQLLSVKNFNNKNQLIKSTVNRYKQFQNEDNENGITQESFKYINRYRNWKSIIDYNGNVSWSIRSNYALTSVSKVTFPSQLESTSTMLGGYSNTTYFDKYDFLTGQVLETRTISSDGQSFKTSVIPAYTKTKLPYKSTVGYGMGSKVDDLTNKNMLSQTAANYSYILDKGSNTWKVTGVGITTWNNIWSYRDANDVTTVATADNEKIWRKHKSYVWNGIKDNGIFTNYNSDDDTDDGFDWTVGVGSQPVQWKQVSETTLYSHFSAPLETKDINGNYASTKMDYNNSKIFAVGNARHGEIFYTGMEESIYNSATRRYFFAPGISGEFLSTSDFHTGKKSIGTSSTSPLTVLMKGSEHRAGKYKLSVWALGGTKAVLTVNGINVPFVDDYIMADIFQLNVFGEKVSYYWQLKTAYIDVPSTDCTISLSSSIATSAVSYDDLMIRPIASSITGYVYNEWDELSYIIGNNGLATKFEYDAAGRLIKTYSEFVGDASSGFQGGFKLMKANTYHNRFL